MGWLRLLGVDCALEPVVTGSPKVRLPRAVHPERVTAPTIKLAMATTVLDVLRDTRILISSLVRRYSTRMRD